MIGIHVVKPRIANDSGAYRRSAVHGTTMGQTDCLQPPKGRPMTKTDEDQDLGSYPDSITLVSHPSRAWPRARELYTAQDGLLLCISHRPLFTACERLRDEGWPDTTVVIVTDANAERQDQAAKIGNMLA